MTASKPTPPAVKKSPQLSVNLSVAIVLYESPLELLEMTLHSLRRAVALAQQSGCLDQVAVALVDNFSTDEYRVSAQALADAMPSSPGLSLSFISQADNRGFGAGHNVALAQLTSDQHLILNPDVELAPDALAVGITALAQRDEAVLLCPSATGTAGEPAYLCKRYPSITVLLLRGFAPALVQGWFAGLLDQYEYREMCQAGEPSDVEIASGCFMLLKTSALRTLQGFDERYFLYFEDFDLSLRLREEDMGSLVYWPDMRIVHHGGHAARKGLLHLRYFVASGWRFFARHGWRLV